MVRLIKTPVWIKFFSVFLFMLLFGAYVSTFAVFDGNPYTPGSTLDPECAPTDINCKVAGPWLTGSSNIYHNGNVNVGSETSSVSASIGGGFEFENIVTGGTIEIPNYGISMILNNEGNPVIAYYTNDDLVPEPTPFNLINHAEASVTGLVLIICLDSECADSEIQNFESDIFDMYGSSVGDYETPSIKIGSDGFVRMAYANANFLMYAECNDEICSDPEITIIKDVLDGGESNGAYGLNTTFSLDENDNPYILYIPGYSSGDDDRIVLARYTGTGIEDTCDDPNWKCVFVPSGGYGLSGGEGNYIKSNSSSASFLDSNNRLNFLAWSGNMWNGGNYEFGLFTCNDIDCTAPIFSYLTPYTEGFTQVNMIINKDSNDNPYIAFSSTDWGYGSDIFLFRFIGSGDGINNCSDYFDDTDYNYNWSCDAVVSKLDTESNTLTDFKLDSDNNPRITYVKQLNDSPYTSSAYFVKCTNSSCSNKEEVEIFNLDTDNWDYYQSPVSMSMGNDDLAYLSYGYITNPEENNIYEFKIDREVISESVEFNPDGDDFFTFGDVGIKNNLFIDGDIISQGGIYLNDIELDDINNVLYNVDGDLYWNGAIVNTGVIEIPVSLLGSTSILGTETWLGTDPNNMGGASTQETVFIGDNSGFNASSSWFSNFIGYQAGYEAQNSSNSNFLGVFAGYQASNSPDSNFIGYYAGYGSAGSVRTNFIGYSAGRSSDNADYSNFLGYYAGSSAGAAQDSNFLGRYAGQNATWAHNSNFFGQQAGQWASQASQSNFFGYYTGESATNASNSNFIGNYAGNNATSASYSNFIGFTAGRDATLATKSNFIGYGTANHATNAANSIFIGTDSGRDDTVNNTATYNDTSTFANTSILLGHKTRTGGFSNSIAIGAYATNTAVNQFMIGSTTRPINTTVWKGTSVTATLDTATGLITTSDERLKTNIHKLNNNTDYYELNTDDSDLDKDINNEEVSIGDMTVLEKVVSIIPVRYDWRDNPEDEYSYTEDLTPKNIGFIAQNLELYFPEVVYTGTDENEYKGVNYANMTPILVEAIREMDLKVKSFEDFEAEVNTFRDNLGAWLANAENKIIRIFTGEICLTDGSEEGPVCLNANELRELKRTLNTETDSNANQSDDEDSNGEQNPPTATCSDGLMNQDETGVDEGGVCVIPDPTCTDGILNQDETEIDTGGVCTLPADPTCSDGIMNQDEIGIDEGGVCTPA